MSFTNPVVIAAALVLTGVLAFAVARAGGWRMRVDLLFMPVPTAALFVAVAVRAYVVGGDIHAPAGRAGGCCSSAWPGWPRSRVPPPSVCPAASGAGHPLPFSPWPAGCRPKLSGSH